MKYFLISTPTLSQTISCILSPTIQSLRDSQFMPKCTSELFFSFNRAYAAHIFNCDSFPFPLFFPCASCFHDLRKGSYSSVSNFALHFLSLCHFLTRVFYLFYDLCLNQKKRKENLHHSHGSIFSYFCCCVFI